MEGKVATIVTRSGQREAFDAERLFRYLEGIRNREPKLDDAIDVRAVVQRVADGTRDGISTHELEGLAAECACYMATKHPDYSYLAGRIAVSTLHKSTSDSFSNTIARLRSYKNLKNGEDAPLVSDGLYQFVMRNAEKLDAHIDYNRDYRVDYFGYKTLERSYLLRVEDDSGERKIVERPQHMLLRVSLGIWCAGEDPDVEKGLETYDKMSKGEFTHASPTLFNSGTTRPQLSSCFLVAMKDDSIEGIYETLKECALISKSAGGIGFHIHNVRATGSYIRGTNGQSNGLIPMLRVFNDTARYVDQGGGKRKGAFAVYLEPWHADIFDFLQLRKNHGKEEQRARDLFYGLWIPDLFMKRVEAAGEWSLFCPNEAAGLADVWGEQFEQLYLRYESEGKARRRVKARELWHAILEAQIETGTPYMLYKDNANRKSNHQHLGTIKCSNLCTEIIEYTSKDETAVCNLASISLPSCVVGTGADGQYDFDKLRSIVRVATRNLDRVIDVNFYPTEPARNSNLRHRPIGLGVQGLADTFLLLGYAFTSSEARKLNVDIFETIYYASLEMSCELAATKGTYPTYVGSPVSMGKLQHDMWGVTPKSGRWDWAGLRQKIAQHGVRNSLLVAPMPTASTSQILGNNECFEPFTSNLYIRRVLSGEFPIVNKYLVRDLVRHGMWNEAIRNQIIASNGSVLGIEALPAKLKEQYRTVWEIKQRDLLDMAIDRAPYIDQSASLNVFIPNPNFAQLTSMHFHAWKNGLKTGMYYLRTQPAADPIKFTVASEYLKAAKPAGQAPVAVPTTNGNHSKEEPPTKRQKTVDVDLVKRKQAAEKGDGMVFMCTKQDGCIMCGA